VVTFSKEAGHVLHVHLVVFHNPPTFHVPSSCLSGPAPASGVEGHLVLALLISARGICWGKLFIFSFPPFLLAILRNHSKGDEEPGIVGGGPEVGQC
jgi:hypothetical protein